MPSTIRENPCLYVLGDVQAASVKSQGLIVSAPGGRAPGSVGQPVPQGTVHRAVCRLAKGVSASPLLHRTPSLPVGQPGLGTNTNEQSTSPWLALALL